jgi:hypothetical protein
MPLKLRHPLTPKKPTGNSIPRVTASVTTLFHNRHAKYRKYTESRLRSTTDQPSYVPSTSGQRQSMPLKLRHPLTPKNRPEIVFPVTASVTTLFHNRHAKYRKIHRKSASFDDRSATVCPIDFRSTAIDATETPAPSDASKNRPEIVFPVTASVTTLFHNRHAKYRKYTESRLRSTTDQPPYVPSTSGQRQSMPLKHRHPLTPKNPTGNSIPRHRKRHNTFP